MRAARVVELAGGYYHLISRVIERKMILNEDEKERIRKTMRAMEGFAGVQVLTFCVLDNHLHVLLHVPPRVEISDEELVRRLGLIYDKTIVEHVAEHLAMYRKDGQDAAAESLKAKYTYRMYNISQFMKTFKQRITQSYNLRHGRNGTLWEGRFKSLLVQGLSASLATVAAYIDLNSVRAGIAKDPKDYRFSGYAEAVAGSKQARAGLCSVVQSLGAGGDWAKVSAEYRKLLYVKGETYTPEKPGKKAPAVFRSEVVRQVLAEDGKLTLPELLHCRVRYFTDGLILGSKAYVDDAFQRFRSQFGPKRTTGARPMRNGFDELFTARRLRLNVITMPPPVGGTA